MVKKKSIILLIVITLLGKCLVWAQHSRIDSLHNILLNSALDQVQKTACHLQLSKCFLKTNIDSAKYYNIEASNIAHSINNTSLIAQCYMSEGNINYEYGDFENAIKSYNQALSINPKLTKRELAEFYNALGLTYLQLEEYEKGENNIKQSIKIYYELNDPQKISTSYINLGSLYGSQDKTIQATDYFIKALKIKRQLNDSIGIAGCYTNLSNVYQRVGDYKKSLDYAITAKNIRISIKANLRELAGIYNNIGVAYDALGNLQAAMEHFHKGIEIAEKYNSSYDLTQLYCNVGQSFNTLKNSDSGIYYINKSIKIAEKSQNEEGLMYGYNYLSVIYFNLNKYPLAIDYAKKSLAISEANSSISMIVENAAILYKIYKQINDCKTALIWLEKHHLYNDSLQKMENIHAITQLNYTNQLEDRDNAIKFLSKENEVKNQENKMQRLYIYIFICVAILVISFSYVYYKQVKLLSSLNTQLEEQNKQIALQTENLSQINSLKDRVISVMSHDMRGPINSLYAVVEMFNSKQLTNEELTFIFPELGKNVNNVSILLENILAWVKSQMSKDNKLSISEFNLHDAIDEIIKVYQPSANQKHIDIKNLIPTHLLIKTDKDDLSLIIRNLVNNAIKFSNSGQKIELLAERKLNEMIISVKDYGVGMTNEEIHKLFNPEKLHSSIGTNKEKGTGLGLLLVKVSVEKLNGTLIINSTKNSGSIFSFSLPQDVL